MEVLWTVSIFMLVSGLLGVLMQPLLIRFAAMTAWYDIPDHRKLHKQAISAIGGIGIYLSVWFSFIWGFGIISAEWQAFFVASIVLFLLSLVDDVMPISAIIKLLAQIGLSLSLCQAGLIFNIEHLLGVIYPYQNVVNVMATIFFIVLMLNAINFMDGINGLAGTLCTTQLFWLAIALFFVGLIQWAAFAVLLIAAVIGFLKYNFGQAKIFMGDNGSTFLGLTIAILVIKLFNVLIISEYSVLLWYILFIVALPIVDLFRVVLGRMSKGKSPFSPDRTHLHHLMLKANFSCEQICLAVALLISGGLFSLLMLDVQNGIWIVLFYFLIILCFYAAIYEQINKVNKQTLLQLD